MTQELHLLLVTDTPGDITWFTGTRLEDVRTRLTVVGVCPHAQAPDWLPTLAGDVILLGLGADPGPGLETLMRLRLASLDVPVVVLADPSGEAAGLEALAAGAQDYLLRGACDPSWVVRTLRSAVERHQACEALRRSEGNLDTILSRWPDGLVVTDVHGQRLFANAATEALWRLAGIELGPVPFGPHLVAGDTRQLELRGPDDGWLTVESRVVEAQWHGQLAFLVFLRDITHRRRNEHQLQVASDTLKQTIRDLVDRNTEIQLFYHTLSHELKTPLASAREFISIAMDGLAGPLTETQLEYLGIARESCDQLGLYVNDLLDVTRLETGKMSIDRRPVALAELVERVLQVFQPEAARRQITLESSGAPSLPPVPVDSQRITQVLTNLINNALKFTPAGGQVHLHFGGCPEDSRFLQVTVRDTGRGIAADQHELIFKRLHQVNASEVPAASRSGLGLGLYICRELVELHGGRIWVESQPGQGSAFKFTLPREPTTTARSALVVDDEAIIRDTLCAFLQSESFDATGAAGGAAALELLRTRPPTVVVLDLQMPGMDGAETLRLIRREWPDIPVVISTGYPKGDLMERLAAYAPFAVLEKPYLPQALLNTIRALIH